MDENRGQIVTHEMIEARRRGEHPRLPDGSPIPKFGWLNVPVRNFGQDLTRIAEDHHEQEEIRLEDGWLERQSKPAVLLIPGLKGEIPLWPLTNHVRRVISDELISRLLAWERLLQSGFDRSWKSADARQRWKKEAFAIEHQLRETLRDEASLAVILWPLDRDYS
jgi:hypothetical protein